MFIRVFETSDAVVVASSVINSVLYSFCVLDGTKCDGVVGVKVLCGRKRLLFSMCWCHILSIQFFFIREKC